MEILKTDSGRERFLELLLEGDEQETMVRRYLDRGDLFALYDNGLKGVCLVTDEGNGTGEIKNIAIVPYARRQGYGNRLLRFVCRHYAGRYRALLAGTGESPRTIPFYEQAGFRFFRRIPDFFTDHYDHPIVEDGVLLKDMVYFRKEL